MNSVDNYVMNSISITSPCLKNTSDTHNSTVLRNGDAAVLSTENDNHVENLRYVSGEFVVQNDINYREVLQVLKKIRLSNINRVIIGHLNVNFFAVKIDAIKTIIPGNVDIVIFGETKLDSSYPTAQLMFEGV